MKEQMMAKVLVHANQEDMKAIHNKMDWHQEKMAAWIANMSDDQKRDNVLPSNNEGMCG